MKEYIVLLKDPANKGNLHQELINSGGNSFVPQRIVECLNDRPFNEHMAHYNLTDDEAKLLQQDDRVKSVELQWKLRPEIKLGHHGIRIPQNFDQSANLDNTISNWALLRCTNKGNIYSNTTNINSQFAYDLDGTGVDVVIIDNGVEAGHPEFAVNADGTGGSRVIDFDWSTLGVTGCPTSTDIGGYLGDFNGHGTHTASVVAGNSCGWASGANIYTIRAIGGNSTNNFFTGQPLGVFNIDIVFDLVKAFHLQKVNTGNFRPTIINNSWGFYVNLSDIYDDGTNTHGVIDHIVWIGTTYTSSNAANCGITATNSIPISIDYINASIDSCSNSGVIIVSSAMNSSFVSDRPGGIDYNNYFYESITQQNFYYHRGTSPAAANTSLCIGATDITNVESSNTSFDYVAYFSNRGPQIDIWAPGVSIMGAYSQYIFREVPIRDSRDYRYYLSKLDGTSESAPQVSGVLACLLQSRPYMTTQEAKQFLLNYADANLADYKPNDSDFGLYPVYGFFNNVSPSSYKLFGATNGMLYMPFNTAVRGKITTS